MPLLCLGTHGVNREGLLASEEALQFWCVMVSVLSSTTGMSLLRPLPFKGVLVLGLAFVMCICPQRVTLPADLTLRNLSVSRLNLFLVLSLLISLPLFVVTSMLGLLMVCHKWTVFLHCVENLLTQFVILEANGFWSSVQY